MVLDDFSLMLENSINPLITFNANGEISFLNKSANMLSSIHISKELYALALEYAPRNFGFKTTYIDLYYPPKSFYAIMIAYQNEDNISILLYSKHIEHKFNTNEDTQSDINLLLESSIEYFTIYNETKIRLFTDYDIPLARINQNNFFILMRKLLSSYTLSSHIDVVLKIKIDKIIEIDGKRHHIIDIIIKSNQRDDKSDREIKKIAEKNNILLFFDKTKSILEIACI